MRFLRASVLVLILGCVTSPAAHADSGYGPGSYTVPRQLPYGIYVARAEPGDYRAGCTFTSWTGDGRIISSDGGTQTDTVTADITGHEVAKFITHGCTPWTRVG